MFNKIISSPNALGITLSAINLGASLCIADKSFNSNLALSIGLLFLPLLFIALYTYFTKLVFTKDFKYRAIVAQFIFGLGIEPLLFGRMAAWLKGPSAQTHPAAVIISFTLTILVGCLINYVYLTYGNKLGLWLLKKNK